MYRYFVPLLGTRTKCSHLTKPGEAMEEKKEEPIDVGREAPKSARGQVAYLIVVVVVVIAVALYLVLK